MSIFCLQPFKPPADIHFPDAQLTGAEIAINESGVASSSRGLVGDTVFAVLPNVKPIHTFAITIAFQLVSASTGSFSGSFAILTHMEFLDMVDQTLA